MCVCACVCVCVCICVCVVYCRMEMMMMTSVPLCNPIDCLRVGVNITTGHLFIHAQLLQPYEYNTFDWVDDG